VNVLSENSCRLANVEVLDSNVEARAIVSEHFLSSEERALRDSRVLEFRLNYLNRVVFEVIINDHLSNSVRLQAAFDT